MVEQIKLYLVLILMLVIYYQFLDLSINLSKYLSLNLSYFIDLTPVWHWNSHILFVYLVAEYPSDANVFILILFLINFINIDIN